MFIGKKIMPSEVCVVLQSKVCTTFKHYHNKYYRLMELKCKYHDIFLKIGNLYLKSLLKCIFDSQHEGEF